MSSSSKEIAKRIQERGKELGYDLKLTHAYELLASIAGHKSWNVQSAKEKETSLPKPSSTVANIPSVIGEGQNTYAVKVKCLAEVKSYLTVKANSLEEARYLTESPCSLDSAELSWETCSVCEDTRCVTEIDDSKSGDFLSYENQFQSRIASCFSVAHDFNILTREQKSKLDKVSKLVKTKVNGVVESGKIVVNVNDRFNVCLLHLCSSEYKNGILYPEIEIEDYQDSQLSGPSHIETKTLAISLDSSVTEISEKIVKAMKDLIDKVKPLDLEN